MISGLSAGEQLRPDHAVLRVVVDPLPARVERAWRAYDRLQERVIYLQRHPPRVEVAEQQFRRDFLEAALAEGDHVWPSADGVLAVRHRLAAHKEAELAVYGARSWASALVGKAIVACERSLVEALDDLLGALQHEAHLRKAAHVVPLGVSGDGLLAAGPDTAAAAAQLGEAAGRYEQIKAARRVLFDYVAPTHAPWLDVVAEGIEDGPAAGTGAIWASEIIHSRQGAEPEPWAGGVGGELHYAVLHKVRLRVRTAAQLDEAGYEPPGYVLQPIGMG
jgi:hypothetical protein